MGELLDGENGAPGAALRPLWAPPSARRIWIGLSPGHRRPICVRYAWAVAALPKDAMRRGRAHHDAG